MSRIFISYSHRDSGPEWKAALLRALHVFERHHLLDVWQDGRIRDSSFWHDDIKLAMSSARLAVVLLTKEALESQYIIETEFPFLRERQRGDKLPVFPVVCEECNWKAHDWLRATQAPNESNPLSQLSKAAQDRVFRKLATDIAEELSRAVLTDLPRSDQPPAPDHVYLDKFPLTRSSGPREEKLIGREQELALLDLAFAQPHTAIVSLVAWGGVGKTMLVQHWLQRLQREGWFGTRRVYAWSFYSQGTKEDRQASEDTFLAHALEWFGVQCEPTLSPWDKGCLLADAIGRERTLLILDGIEPLQYPPGPMGGQLRAPGVQSLLKRLARKASDAEHGGLCLVTTREPLTDLADFQRRPDAAWGSVLRVDLGNLIEEAGAALLHQAGTKRAGAAEIKADDTELLAASREVDGHALTLNLLGRFLARAHGGDIRRRDLVKFGEADRKEQGGTTFKMLAAFENWFATEGDIEARSLAVLRMLGVFDRPADAGCLGALRRPPVITGLTESLFVLKRDSSNGQVSEQPLSDKAWNDVTHFLSDFGLITIQADADENEFLLDCHPLVREHFAKRFQNNFSEAWRSSHLRLYDHLTKTTKESSHPTLGALQPLYQAVSHGCLAGMHQDACVKVYQRRILKGDENYSSFKLGATSLDLQAIRCFFDIPWAHLSPNLDAYEEGWLLNETGCALHSLGRLNEARDAALAALKFNEDRGETGAAGIVLALLTAIEADLGNVSSALRAAECSVEFSSLNIIPLDRVGGHRTYADVLFQWGDFKKALTEFEVAEGLREESKRKFPFLNLSLCIPFEHSELLLHNSEGLAWLKQTDTSASVGERLKNDVISSCSHVGLRTSTDTENQEQPILHGGLSHLTLGRLSLYQLVLLPSDPKSGEFLSYARKNLEQALAALHRSANATHIPRGFLSRAWLRFVESDSDGARADLDEAWDIAERGPMRLHMADIHLHRARLFFRQKPYPWKSPQADLAAAEKLINDCGYHRRDQELADAKSAILGQS